VMSFPCPHCGADQALTDRKPDEIKPIIPLDLQESFEEPPPPIPTSEPSKIPSYRPSESPHFESHVAPVQTPPVPPRPPPPPVSPPQTTPSPTTLESLPPTPLPIKKPPQAPTLSMEKRIDQVAPLAPSKPFIAVSKDTSKATFPIDDITKQFKQFDSYIKEIDSKQKKFESQAKKFEANFQEIDKKLEKFEKSLKILLKTNQKLESIHKDTFKDLKKVKL